MLFEHQLEQTKTSYCQHEKPLAYIYLGLLILIPTFYILITHHTWEDFFITFKFSKNLAVGSGLVYMPGEKVYGFTSVINTLLLTLTYLVTGKHDYQPALNLYRIISILAFSGGVFYLVYTYRIRNPDKLAAVFFVAIFLAFETKTIVFTSNGQEAGFIALFLLPLAIILFYSHERWFLVGALFAGLMYTRPDGFVYWSSILFAKFIFSVNKSTFLKYYMPRYLVVFLILYLPWLVFTWIYYGSPIPNTILAKSAYSHLRDTDHFYAILTILSRLPWVITGAFRPVYADFGGWPDIYGYVSLLIGLFSFLYWVVPGKNTFARYLSFAFAMISCYLAVIQANGVVFPWYYPPAALLGIVVFVLGVFDLFSHLKISTTMAILFSSAFCVVIFTIYINLFVNTVTQMYFQQRIIEDGNRKQIGEWLFTHSGVNDRIFLEPVGYIGYFSQRKMLDYPGLVSPEVARLARKYSPFDFTDIIDQLKPEWLVLRPSSIPSIKAIKNGTYRLEKIFSVKDDIKKIRGLDGIGYLIFDSTFMVYKKQS